MQQQGGPQWGPNQPSGQEWYGPPSPGAGAQPHRPKRKWPLIVVPIMTLFVLTIGVIFVVDFLGSDDTGQATADETATRATEPPTTSMPPPPPGAPILCDPTGPAIVGNLCFPKDWAPNAVMDGVATEGWSCLSHGERTALGNPVHAARQCDTVDNVGQNYTVHGSIDYEKAIPNPESGLARSFKLSASTSAASSKGESTRQQDALNAVFRVFDITAPHIWQSRPDQLAEATDAAARLREQCAAPKGQTVEGVSTVTPSGYKISCWSSGALAVDDGITYDQIIDIQPNH